MGNPPEEALPTGKDVWFDRALTLLNPVKFLESLPPGKPFVVFNGHGHLGGHLRSFDDSGGCEEKTRRTPTTNRSLRALVEGKR